MIRRPTHVTRRRVAAHACPQCRRLWALSGSRLPSGAWVIACASCGWHDVRGGRRATEPLPTQGGRAGGPTRSARTPDADRPHDVVLAADEDQLVSAVEEHLLAGGSGAPTCLVIATPAHRTALRSRLDDAGVAGTWVRSRLVELDAADTLARILGDDGAPDPERFDRCVGSLVREHAAQGRLRCFGEMVDLLWAAGDDAGALALERLWAALQREVAFSLLCAYGADHVATDDRAAIAGAHDHVVA